MLAPPWQLPQPLTFTIHSATRAEVRNGMSLTYEEVEQTRLARLRACLLGSTCTVRASHGRPDTHTHTHHHHHYGSSSSSGAQSVGGTLLEVRRLWLPPPPFSPLLTSSAAQTRERSNGDGPKGRWKEGPYEKGRSYAYLQKEAERQDGPLYGFVRVKDADHRISGWFPLHAVHVKYPLGLLRDRWHAAAQRASAPVVVATASIPNEQPPLMGGSAYGAGCQGDPADEEEVEGPAAEVVTAPLLSSVYAEVTPGMARTQRAKKQLDYLEERLLRDGKTPTTIRFFVYAGRYVFQPWYFAPYGLLHREYDPSLPAPAPLLAKTAAAAPAAAAVGKASEQDTEAPAPATAAGAEQNCYIRDAYLCPFSLRIFSTFDQMRYETEQYRSQRLRPPGYEIYRDDLRGISCFEVNGSHHVTYCRHLFLLGKSFLENKLAGHDVHSYFFYVVCLHERHVPGYLASLTPSEDDGETQGQADATGNAAPAVSARRDPAMYFAGYFTWEKQVSECNLACIVTLPCFAGNSNNSHNSGGGGGAPTQPGLPQQQQQQQALPRNIGQFMIAVSYELAYRRRQVGSPERPLSDLGAAAYQRFWRRALVKWLYHRAPQLLHPTTTTTSSTAATNATAVASTAKTATAATRGRKRGRPPRRTTAARRRAGGRGRGTAKAAEPITIDVDEESTDVASPSPSSSSSSGSDSEDSTASTTTASSLGSGGEGHIGEKRGRGRRRHTATRGRHSHPHPTATASANKGGASDSSEEEDIPPIITMKDIATEVGLEEQDVLRTMLGMGLLHRSSEDRSMRLVVPEVFLAWEHHKIEKQERSLQYCTFDPSLLVDPKNAVSGGPSSGEGRGGRHRAS